MHEFSRRISTSSDRPAALRTSKRILVIDDDEAFGNLTRLRLEKSGFTARFHRGPFGALHAIRNGHCDLVILDFAMPGLDGGQVVRLVREATGLERMKVLLFSAMDPTELKTQAEKHGVPFVNKGASWVSIVNVVDTILTSRS